MRRASYIFICITFAIAFGQAQYFVNEVAISIQGDSTYVFIGTSSPATFKEFTTENPPRIGIDLINGIHNLPANDFSRLPPGIISSVRSAQNKPMPEPVTRIVLDLVEPPPQINVRQHPEGVMIAIPSLGYPRFERWSSGKKPSLPAQPTQEQAVEEVETVAISKTPAESAMVLPDTTGELVISEEMAPELAMFMRPETLSYKTVSPNAETIEVARYIRNRVAYRSVAFDPFIQPKRSKEVPFGEEPLPEVEGLTVVGIMQSGNLRMALTQDDLGYSYIIGVGDSVENGKCQAITDTSVIFNIVEFGQSRRIELPLTKPKKTEE